MRTMMIGLVAMSLCGCTAITYEHKVAEGIAEAETIAIVRNPNVDDEFVDALSAWCTSSGITHQIVDQPPAEGWSLLHNASWSWDITFYLSDVRVGAYRNRSEVGFATYDVFAGAWSINMSKWQSNETVIKELMERLYGGSAP